jgi:hypothetical protein
MKLTPVSRAIPFKLKRGIWALLRRFLGQFGNIEPALYATASQLEVPASLTLFLGCTMQFPCPHPSHFCA